MRLERRIEKLEEAKAPRARGYGQMLIDARARLEKEIADGTYVPPDLEEMIQRARVYRRQRGKDWG